MVHRDLGATSTADNKDLVTNDRVPNVAITSNTTQTGLTGDKTSTGNWQAAKVTAASGGVFDGGDRVYSPSNPPPASASSGPTFALLTKFMTD